MAGDTPGNGTALWAGKIKKVKALQAEKTACSAFLHV